MIPRAPPISGTSVRACGSLVIDRHVKVAPSLRGYNTDGATIKGNPATGSLRGSSVHECRVLVAAGAEAKFTHVGGSPAPAPAVADYPATCVRNRNGEC